MRPRDLFWAFPLAAALLEVGEAIWPWKKKKQSELEEASSARVFTVSDGFCEAGNLTPDTIGSGCWGRCAMPCESVFIALEHQANHILVPLPNKFKECTDNRGHLSTRPFCVMEEQAPSPERTQERLAYERYVAAAMTPDIARVLPPQERLEPGLPGMEGPPAPSTPTFMGPEGARLPRRGSAEVPVLVSSVLLVLGITCCLAQ